MTPGRAAEKTVVGNPDQRSGTQQPRFHLFVSPPACGGHMASNQPVSSVLLRTLSDGTNVLTLRLGRTATGFLLVVTCNGTILYDEELSDLRTALLHARQTEARLESRGCAEVEARSYDRAN